MELTRPFAENGDRQDFAIETQGNGEMSLQQGFGPLYSQAPESGGLFIDRAKFNQLMYLTTKSIIDNKAAINVLNEQFKNPQINIVIGDNGDYFELDTCLKELLNRPSSLGGYKRVNIELKKDCNLNEDGSFSEISMPFFLKIFSNDNKTLNVDNFMRYFNSNVIFGNLKLNWSDITQGANYQPFSAFCGSALYIYNCEFMRQAQINHYACSSAEAGFLSLNNNKCNNVARLALSSVGGYVSLIGNTGTSNYNLDVINGGFGFRAHNTNIVSNTALNTLSGQGFILGN